MSMFQTVPCSCHAVGPRRHELHRRGFLRLATAAGARLALAPVIGAGTGQGIPRHAAVLR